MNTNSGILTKSSKLAVTSVGKIATTVAFIEGGDVKSPDMPIFDNQGVIALTPALNSERKRMDEQQWIRTLQASKSAYFEKMQCNEQLYAPDGLQRSCGSSYTLKPNKSEKSSLNEKLMSSKSSQFVGRPFSLQSSRSSDSSEKLSTLDGSAPMRRLHFDFVGGGNDQRTRAELSTCLNVMLSRHQDCCLLHFNNIRRCQKAFIHHLFITEMDRRFEVNRCRLLSLELTYFDVRKHENFNVFALQERGRYMFCNLCQLAKWLRMDYISLGSSNPWHEHMHVKFVYLDDKDTEHTTNLDFMQLFLNRIDRNNKWHLVQLLRHGAPSAYLERSRLNGGFAMLAESLCKYFYGADNWFTCMIFDVSQTSTKGTNGMLQLANAAYEGLKSKRIKRSFSQADTTGRSRNSVSGVKLVERRPKHKTHTEMTQAWMNEIDTRFAAVLSTWYEYYDCLQDEKIKNLCKEIQVLNSPRIMQVHESRVKLGQHTLTEVEWYRKKYHTARVLMKSLLKEINLRDSVNALAPYVRVKTQELNEDMVRHKVKVLKLCQTRISTTVRNEIDALRFGFGNKSV